MLLDARASFLGLFALKAGDTFSGEVEFEGSLRITADSAQIYKTVETGPVSLDISPQPEDGSSAAKFRFFRETDTTGEACLQILKGDNSTTIIHQIQTKSTTTFNEQGDDIDFRVEGDNYANLLHVDAGVDAVGINTASPAAQLHVDQSSTTGAKPALYLDQADVSEEFIRFVGAAASATLTQSIVNNGDVSTPTLAAWLKVYVQDDGDQITDGAYFVPIYTLA
jgi:hypothetical protein